MFLLLLFGIKLTINGARLHSSVEYTVYDWSGKYKWKGPVAHVVTEVLEFGLVSILVIAIAGGLSAIGSQFLGKKEDEGALPASWDVFHSFTLLGPDRKPRPASTPEGAMRPVNLVSNESDENAKEDSGDLWTLVEYRKKRRSSYSSDCEVPIFLNSSYVVLNTILFQPH